MSAAIIDLSGTAAIVVVPDNAGTVALPGVTGAITVEPSGPQGIPGPAGPSRISPQRVVGEAVVVGQPLYVDLATGNAFLARADVFVKARVAGLASGPASTGFAVGMESGLVTLADWTAVTGAAALAVGQVYFLGLTPGTLTTSAPSAAGQTITRVGIAIDPQTLSLQLGANYLL